MYSTCSWISLATSNARNVYSATRYLYEAVSATAYLPSIGSSVSAALDARGRMNAKSSPLSDMVASLQIDRSDIKSKV